MEKQKLPPTDTITGGNEDRNPLSNRMTTCKLTMDSVREFATLNGMKLVDKNDSPVPLEVKTIFNCSLNCTCPEVDYYGEVSNYAYEHRRFILAFVLFCILVLYLISKSCCKSSRRKRV